MGDQRIIQKWQSLSRDLQNLEKDRSRLEGTRDQLISNLKSKFKVTDCIQAKKLLEEMKENLVHSEEQFKALIKRADDIILAAEGN